jgi:cation transport regulator
MSFNSNSELPKKVQNRLPESAQDIFREAYNNALEHYSDPKRLKFGDTQEETCYKAAWAAVKEKFTQKSDKWVAIH